MKYHTYLPLSRWNITGSKLINTKKQIQLRRWLMLRWPLIETIFPGLSWTIPLGFSTLYPHMDSSLQMLDYCFRADIIMFLYLTIGKITHLRSCWAYGASITICLTRKIGPPLNHYSMHVPKLIKYFPLKYSMMQLL